MPFRLGAPGSGFYLGEPRCGAGVRGAGCSGTWRGPWGTLAWAYGATERFQAAHMGDLSHLRPPVSPTQAGIRGDSSVGAGFGCLSPLLCAGEETLASMAGMSRQPGTKTRSSRALRRPQAAPAVSVACKSESFLFILTQLMSIFPPSAEATGVCRTQRGAGVPGQRVGALPGRVWPAGDGEGGIRSRSLPLADGSRARRFPGPAAAAAPGQAAWGEGAAPRVPPDFSAVEAAAGSSLSRVR